MSSKILPKISNYPELKTIQGIQNVINFLQNNVVPPGLNNRQHIRFLQKFHQGFIVRQLGAQPTLFYNPNQLLMLEVLGPNAAIKQQKMQDIYDSRLGLSIGLSAFYHQIAMAYVGISKILSDEFLRKQVNHLIQRTNRQVVNAPIIPRCCQDIWGCDLIDVSSYSGYAGNRQIRYLMTVIDYFSNFAWSIGITNRENGGPGQRETLANAFQSICQRAGTHPHTMIVDNEWVGGFSRYCLANNIQMRYTRSYSPGSSGRIERFNQTLRDKMKDYMVRTNGFSYYGQLQNFVFNYNNQQNSYAYTPQQIWQPGYNPPPANYVPPIPVQSDQTTPQQRNDAQLYFHLKRANQLISRAVPLLALGDHVVVDMKLFSSNQRRAFKAGTVSAWNKVMVKFSPMVCTISRVIVHPVGATIRTQYELQNLQGVQLMSGVVPQKFFSNDLIKVGHGFVPSTVLPHTIYRGEQMNRLV